MLSTPTSRVMSHLLWSKGTGTAEHRRGYVLFRDAAGKTLIEIGDPVTLSWWRGGRPASRTDVLDAIKEGMPALRKLCKAELLVEHQNEANRLLDEKLEIALRLVPPDESKSIISLS